MSNQLFRCAIHRYQVMVACVANREKSWCGLYWQGRMQYMVWG